MQSANRFHPIFPDDLVAATAYYDGISSRLGDRFRDCVNQMLQTICERPESFSLVSVRLRAAMIRNFSNVVLYQFVDQTLFFTGLFHAASAPKRWIDRDEDRDANES
jgi:hypothetical protein